MRTIPRVRSWVAGLAALAVLAAAAVAGPVEDYRAAYDVYRAAMQDVGHHMASTESTRNARIAAFTAALNRLNDLTDVAEREDFVALDPKASKRLVKLDKVIRKNLEKGLGFLFDEALAEARANKKAAKKHGVAGKKADQVLKIVKKIPVQTAILFEKGAKTAGVHPGGKTVTFKTFARDAEGNVCTDPPVVNVVNLDGNAVEASSVVDLGNGKFSVTMGDAFGAARIEITVCGATDFRFLQNDGTPPPPDPRDPDNFIGSWSGTWRTTRPGLCKGVSGVWSASFVVNGNDITGNWTSDGGASGAISGSISGGLASFLVGGGGGVSFQGTVTGDSISGNFTDEECPDGSGRIRGTFKGGRN